MSARGTIYVGYDADEDRQSRASRAAIVAKYSTAQEHHYPSFRGEGAWLVTVELDEYRAVKGNPDARLMPLPNADGTDFEEAKTDAN